MLYQIPTHTQDPADCPRCRASERAACPKCGHSLTGLITHNQTACEYCGLMSMVSYGGLSLERNEADDADSPEPQ